MTETPTRPALDSKADTADSETHSSTSSSEISAQLSLTISSAISLKTELAECYSELADQLEHCNNPEAAETFQQLSEKYQQHIQRLLQISATSESAAVSTIQSSKTLASNTQASAFSATRSSPTDDLYAEVHYLMTAYHVVRLALDTELKTQNEMLRQGNQEITIASISSESTNKSDALLLQQAAREQEDYLQMLKLWLGKLPSPDHHWDEDPDPPNLDD